MNVYVKGKVNTKKYSVIKIEKHLNINSRFTQIFMEKKFKARARNLKVKDK
jgi:hypothetical protein